MHNFCDKQNSLTDAGTEAIPNSTYRCVDVRDVAYAHILAFENPSASGRYCLVEKVAYRSEVMKIIHKLYPTLNLPKRYALAIFSIFLCVLMQLAEETTVLTNSTFHVTPFFFYSITSGDAFSYKNLFSLPNARTKEQLLTWKTGNHRY